MARKGFLPKEISIAEKVICAACQMGKAHKTARGTSPITKSINTTEPGDLIHMDQAESTNPCRPFTFSGRNSKNKIHIVTIFVDGISKKVFAAFQRSTGASETIKSKPEVEVEANSSKVGIKSFREDNGIFKSRKFIADIVDKDQRISF